MTGEAAAPAPRSSRGSALPLIVLSLLGMGVSAYLTWHRLAATSLWCGGVGSCDQVNASRFAQLLGIPVAYLGLAMYLTLLVLSLISWRAGDRAPGWIPTVIFGLTLFGFFYSAYLTGIELFVLHAICVWCVTSAVIITLLLLFSWRHAVARLG